MAARKSGRGGGEIVPPTPELMARGGHELVEIVDRTPNGRSVSIGKAFRRTRQVETLSAKGYFSEAEAKALKHYRHHADMTDRSPTKDSVAGLMMAGLGRGEDWDTPMCVVHASRVAGECEAAAGSLRDILRAVIVNDVSLSEWASLVGGSYEVVEKGRTRMKPKRRMLEIAKLEIRMAAKRVQAELDA
jgi:hypothetical protein